ncbi:MAG: S26 family signal peptidase [Chloroflexi bacterium]|nr:S26 family signal peptidase [Chloroflexota bacterium]
MKRWLRTARRSTANHHHCRGKAPDHADPAPARLYVLGDNAAASRDSRQFGPVPRRSIIGRAWLRY